MGGKSGELIDIRVYSVNSNCKQVKSKLIDHSDRTDGISNNCIPGERRRNEESELLYSTEDFQSPRVCETDFQYSLA